MDFMKSIFKRKFMNKGMENQKDLISVIVPVYKVEKYLDRCVESIVNQSYSNLEIILVDDGSPDKCPQLCDAWGDRDSRITVIHKENGGLSDTRNVGLEIAKGEFIAFVDSDDWIASDYLSVLIQLLNSTGADICECEILKTSNICEYKTEQQVEVTEYDTVTALKELICDGVFHQHVWNKLYKRDCIGDILFPIGKTNEDEYWTYQAFGNATKIVKTNKVLYYYYQREESIMGTRYGLKRLDALEAKKERQAYIERNYPELTSLAKNNLFGTCIYSGQMTLKCLKGNERNEAQRIINLLQKQYRPTFKELRDLPLSNKVWIFWAKINFWFLCRVKNSLGKGF